MGAGKKNKRASRAEDAPSEAGPQSAAAAPPSLPWGWLFAGAVFVLALLVYAPALKGPFVLDDYDLLEGASVVRTADPGQMLRSLRPVLMLTYIANHRLAGGFEPFGFHLVNVLLHALNALILWRLMAALFGRIELDRRMEAFRPLFVYGLPLLWLLSPIQTESVAYISSRSEVLAATFYLAGLWSFVAWRDRCRWATAGLVMACFVGTVLTKQDKLTLPVAIVLLDYLLLSRCDWRGLKKSWPTYGLFGLGVVAGFLVVVKPVLSAKTAGFGLDWREYFFTELRMYFRYLGQLAFPFGLNHDPDIAPSASLGDHFSWLALLGLLALVGAAVWFHRRAPLAAFGVLFFLIALAPTSSFVPVADFAAERRMYLPSIGFFLLLLWVMARLFEYRSKAPYLVTGALLCVYAGGAWARSAVWSDELRLWQDAASKSPDKERPWTWIGRIYSQRGQRMQAEQAWQRAAELVKPGSEEEAFLLSNLGLASAQAKDYDKAIAYYRRALDIFERAPQIWAQLAVAQIHSGRTEEGWQSFEKAMTYKARLGPEVFKLRGQELYQAGRYAEAADDFRRALEFTPDDADAQQNYQIARKAAGQ
ncbi:MAG: tetratricopeptide repeat protein [Acidobacteria bacterium]|nr:tetratricopeptide repeat protein [Acidobacteriota bacterium]